MSDAARLRVTELEVEMCRRLGELRRRREISQVNLSRVIGLHGTVISKLEAGDRILRYGEAVLLSSALGQPIDRMVEICGACFEAPPTGFTCNTCGRAG